eukprot:gene13601-biopygen15599
MLATAEREPLCALRGGRPRHYQEWRRSRAEAIFLIPPHLTSPTPPHPEARPEARPGRVPRRVPGRVPGRVRGASRWRGPASITRRASGASEESALPAPHQRGLYDAHHLRIPGSPEHCLRLPDELRWSPLTILSALGRDH